MADPEEVQGAVDAAIKKGEYPDRKAAIAGLTRQLVDYQKGALKDKLAPDPVVAVEKERDALWKVLLERAGGDEEKAARLYLEQLKKLGEGNA